MAKEPISKQVEKDHKEIRFSLNGLELKEEDGEFYSYGFVATTHPDRSADPNLGVDGDILSKEVLEQILSAINDGVAPINSIGSSRAVSLQHDWIKEGNPDLEPAGMICPPAELKQTDDGHWGVYVKVHHNKTHPQFEDIKYKVENGYFPGYSIEYAPGESTNVQMGDKVFRFLKTISTYVGHAFASARKIANPSALITSFGYKEIESNLNSKEDGNMEEEQKIEETPVVEPIVETPIVEEAKEEPKEEKEKEEAPKVTEEVKEEAVEEKEVKSETPKLDVKEVAEKVIDSKEFKETLESLKVESKTLKTKGEAPMNVSIKEMKEAFAKGDLISAKEAALNSVDNFDELFAKTLADPVSYTAGLKSNLNVKVSGKGLKADIAIKDTLVVGDNASSYTQSNVEFADVFAPGIIDTFNNQTNLFGFLKKEQHIGGNYYQWKMVTNKDPNSVDTFVAQTDVSITKNFATKLNYQTPLKIARRGVSVSDFIKRYSARSLGDLFALEVELQMSEMMNDVNAALFAEMADGTGNAPLGLEAVADSAGNTTLYGYSRSTANRLSPDAAGNTYTAVGGSLTEVVIRTKVTNLEKEGTRFGNIAIVASPAVRDYLFNLLDGNRRFNTTEVLFGFNKANVPSYDGTPIIVDSDCNEDALYVIDTKEDVIVIGMAPGMTSLAKVGAATEAYVQMDFAHVYKQPRRIGMLDTLSGP